MALLEEAGSDVSSVGECDYPYEPCPFEEYEQELSTHLHERYPFEEYEQELSNYLQWLALLHRVHMCFVESGLLNEHDFLPETMEDVYNANRYSMSWFYEGCYPFDTWEDNYDHWLYDQVFLAMTRADDLVPSWRHGTATLSSSSSIREYEYDPLRCASVGGGRLP